MIVQARLVPCGNCGGRGGWWRGGVWIVCDFCNGTGEVDLSIARAWIR